MFVKRFAGFAIVLFGSLPRSSGHGHLTLPRSSRQGGSLAKAGKCDKGECYWFSNMVTIPGKATLPVHARSITTNETVSGGEKDFFRKSPWLAPGSAAVFGSGCGSAGGGPQVFNNGGVAPDGFEQGLDAIELPEHSDPVHWQAGSVVEVAWAIAANHGGGYSYRLCPADGEVTEECFQSNQLQFAGNRQWLIYANGTKSRGFPIKKVSQGTYPDGSEWARNPVPGCNMCDTFEKCGPPLDPVPGLVNSSWHDQLSCTARCDGSGFWKDEGGCPDGTAQFAEPLPGISGFEKRFFKDFSILDEVYIPTDLEPGHYLLSWRWDCEESFQIWQNCADVIITNPTVEKA